jgi:hypothetical protein
MNQGPPVPPRFYGNVPPGSPLPTAVNDSGAIASLVCGIVSWLLCGFPAGIPAIVLGHNSMKKIRKSSGYLKGKEIALAGTVLGYSSCAFWFAYLALGFFLYQQSMKDAAASEANAVYAIRQINEAEATYTGNYPSPYASHSYAGSLSALGPGPEGACAGSGTREYACLLSGSLAMPDCREPNWCVLQAYKFQLQVHNYPERRDWDYVITAIPVNSKSSGRNFCSTSDGIIRSESSWLGLTAGYNCEECLRLKPVAESR